MNDNKENICIVYSHTKIGDLIWQLPYIEAISNYHNRKITLIVRERTQAKEILFDLSYIDKVEYIEFRKGLYYWVDVFFLWKFYLTNKFTHVYLLDKISRPAIAAKFCKIKNIIGPGIGNQKKWITNKNCLKNEHLKLNYSEQSQIFLKKNNIPIINLIPKIDIKIQRIKNIYPEIFFKHEKKIAFGVDSTELNKIWPEEYFAELAYLLHQKGIADFFYLVCGKNNNKIAEKIISISKQNYFFNCSHLNLMGIIKVMKDSKLFIGNNSGPPNLSSAIGIKSFALISNSSVKELKYSNIIPITPENYDERFDVGVKKIGDNFVKSREEMKKLTVNRVIEVLEKNLK